MSHYGSGIKLQSGAWGLGSGSNLSWPLTGTLLYPGRPLLWCALHELTSVPFSEVILI